MNYLLTIDVEDWFQVRNFSNYISMAEWSTMEVRIHRNMDVILNLLNKHNTKATFFVLGWLAEKEPDLILKIYKEGHEIACHSYSHSDSFDLNYTELKNDIVLSKNILESITNSPIIGYRAPSFSISTELLNILSDLNFTYDSSLFVSDMNLNYGKLSSLKRPPQKKFVIKNDLLEFPLSSYRMLGLNIPWSGGFMFRAIPYWLYKNGMKSIYKTGEYFMFYIHPWEFDSSQPFVQRAKVNEKVKHYYNVKKTFAKFDNLLQLQNFGSINNHLKNCPS